MKTPVVINNRNRVTTLSKLVSWLLDRNVRIIVLDNNSEYPPLLQYYNKMSKDIEIIKFGKNLGHTALYQWKGHLKFKERYFVYTDSDVVPAPQCPKDLVEHLVEAQKKYPGVSKVGAGLEINNLPETFLFKRQVLEQQAKFWRNKKDKDFYHALVDTTFAVYDNKKARHHVLHNCLRANRPYLVEHLPWYVDNTNLSEEEIYYIAHSTTATDWTNRQKKVVKIPKLFI